MSDDEETFDPLLVEAFALHQQGRWAEAAARYRRVLIGDPTNGNALHLLGLVRQAPDGPAARAKMASVGMADGLTMLRRAVRSHKALIPALTNLALFWQRIGRVEEGAVLRHWLILEPDSWTALERLARFDLATGRLDAGEAGLRRLERGGVGNDRVDLALRRCALYRQIAEAAGDPALPAGLVVRGVFRDSSGYAHKVRQFVRHLVAAGVRVWLIDLLHMPTDDLAESQIDPLLLTLGTPVRAKAVLSFTTPFAVEKVPGLATINYSVFEAASIPELFAGHSRRHDAVIVATQSSRDAWVDSGCPAEQIDICPEGVEPVARAGLPTLSLSDTSGRRLDSYRARFLNVSDFNPRKNLLGLLRVWLKATRRADDAALVIKIGKGGDMAQTFAASVRLVVDELGVSLEEAGAIFLLDGKFSDEGMLSVFAACTHYWSMSHGEGWDLPMAQCGAMGLTLVAPRHSAYTAYLDDSVAHMLDSAEVEADFVAYRGLRWWTPDEDAAVETLTRIIRDPDGTRRSAQERLCRDFSWDKAARRLMEALKGRGAL